MNKLIFVPTPLTEESPHSLIKRVVQCHGFSTTGKLNGLCIGPQTFRYMSLTQDSDFAKLFVAEAGIHGPKVLNGFYAKIERPQQQRRFVIGDIEIPITYLRLRSGAYCDGCFDQGWEHQIRDLKFAEYCPYHLKKYLTHCPECHKPVEWWHALDGKCAYCGAALKCQPCTLEKCRLERMLLELMRTRSQLDFDRLLALTRQLGYRPEKPTMPDATRRMIFIGAFSVMTDDSRAILEHLFKLHNMHPDVEKCWIAARFSLVSTAATREASRIFLETKHQSCFNLSYNHTPFLLTIRQLRAALNVSAGQMVKIKKLTPLVQKSIDSSFTADEAVILASKANEFLLADNGRLPVAKKEMLNRAKACLELSISLGALKVFMKYDLLKPCFGSNHAPFFFPADIQQFSNTYEPFKKLSKKIGISTRRLCVILDSLNIKIIPRRNLKDTHRLIKKSDADRVIAATSIKNKRSPQVLNLPRADFSKVPISSYSTLRETAKALQTAIENVVTAIQESKIKGVFRGKKSLTLIPKSEIQNFKSRFTTTTQAAKILKTHPTKTTDLLFGLGIHAVIGPMVNGSRDNIYKTADILRVAKLAESEDPCEHFNYCSKTLTAKRLNASAETLLKIMDAGLIKYIKGRVGAYFRPSWLNQFEERYVLPRELLQLAGLPPSKAHKMIDALADIGILPISFNIHNQSLLLYDRVVLRESYDKFLKKMAHLDNSKNHKTHIHRSTRVLTKGHTPIKDLLNTYDISPNDFSILFIRHGFINTKKINKIIYISDNDRKKCESILDNYCTCTMAAKITPGGYEKIKSLLCSGILENENPIPTNQTQTRLISRSKLKKYLNLLPSSSSD